MDTRMDGWMDTKMDGWMDRYMDGWMDNETDKDRATRSVQCRLHRSITGGVNGLKVSLDDVINHAFITRKKKHPLVLPQTYLHLVPSDLDTKEAQIERYNGRTKYLTQHILQGGHVSLRLTSNREAGNLKKKKF